MRSAYYDGYIQVTMNEDAIHDLTQSGDASDAVEEWLDSIQISGTPDAIREHLSEYGCWDDQELQDDTANQRRLVWLAAGDIRDGLFDWEGEAL
jgi:hypothetical protein